MSKKKVLGIIQDDPWLEDYQIQLEARLDRYQRRLKAIEKKYGSLKAFANGHRYFGFNYDKKKKGWYYREWAPAAYALALGGDFNNWSRLSHPLQRNEEGYWELFLPDAEVKKSLIHGSLFKLYTKTDTGLHDRLPAYLTRAVQNEKTKDFSGQWWQPAAAFQWSDDDFDLSTVKTPFIYEVHVGMAQEKEAVGSYQEFTENVLPRIAALGYNCIQIMAVQEHPYYGSFGYHVSNFFAVSSRFGTPEDLKQLINEAHRLGIAVILDVVHSHAVKNYAEGLNDFDGSGNQYFHKGARGHHIVWDSKLFDYGREEVQQFLLSNLRYWVEEFHFDGFRFDGVSSMLYNNTNEELSFSKYDAYFKQDDWDAVTYLQLAMTLVHQLKPQAICIAEDVSGMPGLCRPIAEGGIGFDYRLGMGIPDFWIRALRKQRDEEWNLFDLWGALNNRRLKEKTIAYSESHDQAMVGDKTIAHWLMDAALYHHMLKGDPHPAIERGMALHKIIRLLTISLGGEGYLNFMGNEFGHPEWIDFPRKGNNWSYLYAQRQWSLADNEKLRYGYLKDFDAAMIHLIKNKQIIAAPPAQQLHIDPYNKIIAYTRGSFIFVANLHADRSIFSYYFPAPQQGTYRIVLNTDDKAFGGYGRIDNEVLHPTLNQGKLPIISLYLTHRTMLVLELISTEIQRPAST